MVFERADDLVVGVRQREGAGEGRARRHPNTQGRPRRATGGRRGRGKQAWAGSMAGGDRWQRAWSRGGHGAQARRAGAVAWSCRWSWELLLGGVVAWSWELLGDGSETAGKELGGVGFGLGGQQVLFWLEPAPLLRSREGARLAGGVPGVSCSANLIGIDL